MSFAEIQNMAPMPTVAVTRALRPSLSSRVKLSPTIPASLPSREMISPVDRTPVSFAATTAVGGGVDFSATGETSDLGVALTLP